MSDFHPNYESRQPADPSQDFTGRDQVRRNWAMLMEAFPDLRVDVERWAVEGSEVWAELHDGRIAAARVFVEEVKRDGASIDDAVAHRAAGG